MSANGSEVGSDESRLQEAIKQLGIVQENVERSGHEKDLGTAAMLARGVKNDLADEEGDR